ncbi:hypothetical protein quinque_009059 [Culex quinquefasciatus]
MSRRENTFRVDYSNMPKKPSFEDVHNFIGNELGLKPDEVTRLQCSRTHGCAFVKVIDNDLAQQIVDQHDGKHAIEHEGKSYPIRIAMEDGAVDVKLFDLSDEVSDDEIIEFLSDYGEVLSVRDLYWEDKYFFRAIPTGVRVVKMFVERNIDSYEVENEQLTLPGYNVICNVDHARRGTAIALKEHIRYSHFQISMDGRLIALQINDTTLCNIYAPSGTAQRADRERFFNNTLAYYLRRRTSHTVLMVQHYKQLYANYNCSMYGSSYNHKHKDTRTSHTTQRPGWIESTSPKGLEIS